jgi:hypothetical protein
MTKGEEITEAAKEAERTKIMFTGELLCTNNPRKTFLLTAGLGEPLPNWQRYLLIVAFWAFFLLAALGVAYFIHPLAVPVLFWLGWNTR